MDQKYKKQNEDNSPPLATAAIRLLLKTNPDHPLAKNYLEKTEFLRENFEKQIEALGRTKTVLPDLKPIDVESFYDLFKSSYQIVNKKTFDESLNNSESRKLARTLIAYFLRKKAFVESPILNLKSTPSLDKGILMIGGLGIGKTSIMETLYKIFFHSQNEGITVLDKEGTEQYLGRYNILFNFYTANEVIKDFKGISRNDRKSDEEYYWNLFWKRHIYGFNYYDDIMTERTLRDFGETVELFKDIFEERYSKKTRSIISINYVGDSVDSTLEAFAAKYGERLYDRLFEQYNIIELKGESLRK